MNNEYAITMATFPDKTSAKCAAGLLVKEQLAACVQLFPIESIYSWKGEICDENEVMLLIKSKTALFDKIKETIQQVHTYEVPEIIQMPITDGLPAYFDWMEGVVGS